MTRGQPSPIRPDASPMRSARRAAFSLAELLVVVGIVMLLVAITLPPLQVTRRRAMEAKCSAQLQQIGRALESTYSEYGFYPLWDDGAVPLRFTWIDVLIQLKLLGPVKLTGGPDPADSAEVAHIGYCPADRRPDLLNAARHRDLIYPPTRRWGGIDYSYGIGAPLSAGGWAWQPTHAAAEAGLPRRFVDHDQQTANRVLAADACAAAVYNLSGQALSSGVWNHPTQFDNTVAWGRHTRGSGVPRANLLFQDGHVDSLSYAVGQPRPVNTTSVFLWHPDEPITVGPADTWEGNAYPSEPPPNYGSTPPGDVFPRELTPLWYTRNGRWTLIRHK